MNRLKLMKILSICAVVVVSINIISVQFATIEMIFEYGYVWGILTFVILFFVLATMVVALFVKEDIEKIVKKE